MTPLILRAPFGLGDAIFVRPVIRDAANRHDLFVETPWPELYEDVALRFLKPERGGRMQMANVRRQPAHRWSRPPMSSTPTVFLYYSAEAFSQGNVYQAMACKMPEVPVPVWDLPDMGPSPFDADETPLVLVRPAVVRQDWPNPSRNPKPEYINEIAGDLKARGYAVVVVCDLSADQEWIVGEMPPHNLALTHGELSLRQLLAAVQGAALVLGGVGWIVPAAVATQTPTYVVLGGNGGANAPEKILDDRMKTSNIGFAFPENLCRCSDTVHDCPKDIPDLSKQWNTWRSIHL
jgi:hypothetical protein